MTFAENKIKPYTEQLLQKSITPTEIETNNRIVLVTDKSERQTDMLCDQVDEIA